MKRKPNLKAILGLVILLAVIGIGVHFLHGFQVQRNTEVFLREAHKARDNEDVTKEIEFLGRYLLANPGDMEALGRYGILLDDRAKKNRSARGRQRAFYVLERVLRNEESQEREKIRDRLIEIAFDLRRFTDARHHLLEKLKSSPQDGELAFQIGICDEGLGRFTDALSKSNGAVDLGLVEQKDWQAAEWYTHATKLDPDKTSYALRLAFLCRRRLEDRDWAESVLREMIKRSDSYQAHLARINYLLTFDRGYPNVDDRLRADLEAARSRLPKDQKVPPTPYLLTFAEVKQALDREEVSPGGLHLILQATGTSLQQPTGIPLSSMVRMVSAARVATLGPLPLEQARTALRLGIQAYPNEASFYQRLATLELRLGRSAQALQVAQKGLEQLPDNGTLLYTLADLSLNLGKKKETEKYLEQLRALGYPPTNLGLLQGRLDFERKQWSKAAEALKEVCPRLSSSPRLAHLGYYLLGECQARLGNPDQALKAYRNALNADSTSIRARQGIASVLEALGRTEDALQQYRDILILRPNAQSVRLLAVRALIRKNLRLPPQKRSWAEVHRDLNWWQRHNWTEPAAVLVMRAEVLLMEDRSNYSRVQKLLTEARKRNPDQVEYWLALAEFLGRFNPPQHGLQPALGSVALLLPSTTPAQRAQRALEVLDEAKSKIPPRNQSELQLARLRFLPLLGKKTAQPLLTAVEEKLENNTQKDQLRLLAALGNAYLRLGLRQESRRIFLRLAQQQPNNLAIHLLLVDLHLQMGEEDQATKVLDHIQQIEGKDGTFWRYAQARRLVQEVAQNKELPEDTAARNLSNARRLLKQAAILRPSWYRIPALLGEVAEREKDFNAAIEHYQKAVDLGDRRSWTIRHLVGLLGLRKRFAQAQEVIRTVMSQERAVLSAGLGKLATVTLLQQEDLDRALDLARKTVPAEKKDYRDQLWLGQILYATGHPEEAEKALLRARALAPNKPEPWVALVSYLVRVGNKEKAKATFEEASKQLSGEDAPLALGACCEALGQPEKAEEYYLTAHKNNQSLPTLRNLAGFYLRTRQFEKAEQYLRTLVRESSDATKAWARRSLARVLAASASYLKFKEALGLLDQNSKADDQSRAQQLARALVLATRTTHRSEAISLLEKIDLEQPLEAEQRFTLARLYDAEGSWLKVQSQMLRLLDSPEGKQMRYLAFYARRLIRHGELNRAEGVVNELKQVAPNTLSARDIEAMLLTARGEDRKAVQLVHDYAQRKDVNLGLVGMVLEGLAAQAGKKDPGRQTIFFTEAEKVYQRNLASSKSPGRYLLLARLQAKRGQREVALRSCKRAAQEKAPLTAVGQLMVAVLRETGRDRMQEEEVELWLRKMLRKHRGSHTGILLTLADLRDFQERYAEALAIYRRIQEGPNKNNVIALNNHAWLLAMTEGDGVEALNLIERAIQQVGPSAEILDTRGIIYLKMGNTSKAITDLRNSFIQNAQATTYFRLALAYHKAGKRTGAQDAWDKARELKLNPKQLHPLEQKEYYSMQKTFQ